MLKTQFQRSNVKVFFSYHEMFSLLPNCDRKESQSRFLNKLYGFVTMIYKINIFEFKERISFAAKRKVRLSGLKIM